MQGAFWILCLVGIVLEFLAGHAVPALLPAFDHISVRFHPGKKLFDNAAMAGIGGANEAVVADLPALPQLAIALTHLIAMGLGGEAGGLRGALNLLAMLVAAGDEQHRFAAEPPLAGDRVTGQWHGQEEHPVTGAGIARSATAL